MVNGDEPKRTAQELWQEYAFLTSELVKFVKKKDWDLVLELVTQSERLQASIDANVANNYITSPQGRDLIASIQQQNQSITADLQRVYNNVKRQQQVSNAYDQPGGSCYAGSLMDRHS